MAQDLQLHQKIGQRLTRQQMRFVQLLELNAPELDEAVENELDSNPALEVIEPAIDEEKKQEDMTPYYLRRASNASQDYPTYDFSPPDNSMTLYDYLNDQIAEKSISEGVAETARYIVGNLDSNGYLHRPLEGILNDIEINTGEAIPENIGREALEVVRSLDPPGVGGANLRETLLLQLNRLPESQDRNDAIRILTDYFEPFSMRHSHKIVSGLKLDRDRLNAANELILTLNPKPGAPFGNHVETGAETIVPDYKVEREGDDFFITLNNRIPELAVQESFREAMKGVERRRGRPKKGTEFIVSRYNDAREFIAVLRQRQETMMAVMTAILKIQKDFFKSGDIYSLRPMMLKDISSVTGLDVSVISRSTANKYVDTPWGAVLPLRALFSDTVTQDSKGSRGRKGVGSKGVENPSSTDQRGADEGKNSELTNRKIEAMIKALVDNEDKKHPLSDEKIRLELLKSGYDISRRTIAKYRDRQGVLIARLRKIL